MTNITRSQAVARIADRTAKNSSGHVTQATSTFREIYLCACSALPIQSRVSNLKSLAQVVLKICSIVCQKLYGSRDLGHPHFQGNYLCVCSAFPIQSRLPNSKSLAQAVFEILRSKRIGVTSLTFQGHVTSSVT